MADLKKLKSRFGKPPEAAEARDNLRQPETPDFIDGRSLRATGRTSQLATRISPEIHHRIKLMAVQERITIAELIETAFLKFESRKKQD